MMLFFHLMKRLSILFLFIISSSVLSQEYKIQFTTPINEALFILPVPNLKIPLNSTINLISDGREIECDIVALNVWNSNNAQKFVRLLSININKKNITKQNSTFTLAWVESKKTLPVEHKTFVDSPYLIYPNKAWLKESILLHPETKELDNTWYTQPQSLYANFVSKEALLTEKGYPSTKYSQWLFDRPRAIYQLFILTDNKKWFTEGRKLVEFYLDNLDAEGKFTLKNSFDLKYLMPNGLLYYYLLSGDNRINSILKTLFERSLIWSPSYDTYYTFWTERHQAAALNIAIAYWEISGSEVAKARIDEIIQATVNMVFYPRDEWGLKGCAQHTYKSHEGKAGNSPVCSPWMTALLADGLWRYYQLTHDKKSAALLNAFGDFMMDNGIYFADKRLKNKVIPFYLSSMNNKLLEIKNQWTDGQHACDVAALIGKSLYIKRIANEDTFLLKGLFDVFVQQCKDINIKYRSKKKDYLPMLPPRRFGWTYSTTSDLPWLELWLNTTKYNE
jgi:hypothetical protein